MGISHGIATTPTKCRIVGGVDRAMQAGGCKRHFWTGLPFQGAATTPTNARIVGGVDRAMQARGTQRHSWTGLPFQGAATTPTKGRLVGVVDGALAEIRRWLRRGIQAGNGNHAGEVP